MDNEKFPGSLLNTILSCYTKPWNSRYFACKLQFDNIHLIKFCHKLLHQTILDAGSSLNEECISRWFHSRLTFCSKVSPEITKNFQFIFVESKNLKKKS